MRLTAKILAIVLPLLAASTAFAQGTGRSLDIQPGARQNGMGAAGVAMWGDATAATYWNPAGLGFTKQGGLEDTYAQLVPGLASDVNYNFIAYVQPVKGWGAFGATITFLSYGQSDQTDNNGTVLGQFGSNEFSPAIYYGTQILPDFSVGAALKFIRIQLAPESNSGVGSTFGMDLGGLYRIPSAGLSFGVNVQNLGPSVTFINEDKSDPLSRNLKVGGAWDALRQKEFGLTMIFDFNQSLVTDEFKTYNGGIELRYGSNVGGRIGYYYDPLGEIKDLTYGVGLGWNKLVVDFASIPQAQNSGLPNVSKLSLGYRF
jgi:hypothetical protein